MDMALPPYYPNLFTNAVDWTFEENSEFPTPISSSYLTATNGYPAFIWPINTTWAPGLTGINSFVPEVGRPYLLKVTMRKTSAVTNGITSWIRPGFIAFKDTAYTIDSYDIIGPTAGLGLTDLRGFINTASWNVNEWYDVFCSWTPDIAYVAARPRIRINRNEADLAPVSDVSYEIKSFEVLPQIKISDIHTEFGGPIPAKISNYYRKSILPAINANFSDSEYTLYSFLESESGIHTTNFSNGVTHYTTDGGNFGPRNDLTFGLNEGSVSLVNDPVEGKVLQSQGVNWGGVVQAKAFGPVSYNKVEAGITYTVTVRKKLVTAPTNTEFSPQMYLNLWCYDSTGHYIGGYGISVTTITVADGWTNITGTYTLANIKNNATLANTVYVRPHSYDNAYIYVNNVGAYNVIVCNCVVQTASFTTTASSGPLKGIGLNKIYNITNGVDEVYVLNGTTWSIDSQQSIKDLGTPRQATNPYTKRITRIGDFFVIDSPTTTRIPTSGTIKFSDFLGSSQTSGPIFYTPDFLGDVDGNNPVSFNITAYSLSNSSITFSYDYLPSGLTNVAITANTVTVNGNTYNANTITFSGKSEDTYIPSYPIGWNVQASDPYITIDRVFYYNNLNLTPTWVTSAGSLGSFANGSTVSIQLSATDPEHKPIEYTIANGGALPSNLNLSYTGLLSGTLNASAGTYPFTIRASDGPFYTDQSFSMVVEQNNPPVWQTPSGQLEAAGTNEIYSAQLVANTAVSYSIISGSLPSGMSLDTSTGIISGTPTGTSQSQSATTFKSFPYMTSNTTPDGYNTNTLVTIPETSTFTSYSDVFAYKVFDGTNEFLGINFSYPYSQTRSLPLVLGITSPHKVNVSSYDVKCVSIDPENANTIKSWQLQGSDDGINWVTVDTRSNITSWAMGFTMLSFTLPNPSSYYQYRIYITEQGVMPSATVSSPPLFVMEIAFKDYASVFTVRATGANSLYSDREFGISVHTGATSISWNSPAAGALGASTGGTSYNFSANTTVINAGVSTVYSVQSGTLPAGTSLNVSTGAITGTLTNTPSSYSFTIRATNNGVYSDRSFSGTVISPPVWQTASGQLVGAGTGEGYSSQLVANTAVSYSIVSGSLPTGMSLNTSTGIISGTPTGTSQSQTATTFKSFPYMTSDTSPAGYTAYALSTIYGTSTLTSNNALQNQNTAYYAFDGLDNLVAFTFAYQTYGFSFPLVLGITAPYKVNVGSYDVKCYSFGVENTSTIKAWQLQGSNDGVNWVTVDNRSNITSWTIGYTSLSFTLSTAVSYYQYRMYITEQGVMPSPSGLSPVIIMEITFKDYASVFTVRATSANGLYVDRDFGISVHTGATSVSWNSPTAGALGVSNGGTSYSFTANTTVVNAIGSTVYSVQSGTLPAGTSLNTSSGAITGTLTNASSSYSFTIRATNNGVASDRSFTGSVAATTVTWLMPSAGYLGGYGGGTLYVFAPEISVVNPVGSTVFSLQSGALPSGTSLNTTTGVVSGMLPNSPFSYAFTIRVTNNGVSSDRSFTGTVIGETIITWNSPAAGDLGSATGGTSYSFIANTSVVNPVGSTTYSVSAGAVPAGTTLDTANGVISGTLTNTPSSYSFTIRATNNGAYADRLFTGTVSSPPVWQTASGQLVAAQTGQSYTTQLAANTATTYSIVSGSLPTGMSLDSSTGIISGTPTGSSQSQSGVTFKSFPAMTSDTSPAGYTAYVFATVSGSSSFTNTNVLQSGNYAFQAFDGRERYDGLSGNYYAPFNGLGAGKGWNIEFPIVLGVASPYKVNVGSYRVSAFIPNNSPKDWQLQGSNDGTNWTTLDTRSNISWSYEETKSFTLSSSVSYYYYRLYVTNMVEPVSTNLFISEISFYDYASVFTVRATAANGLYSDRQFGISVH